MVSTCSVGTYPFLCSWFSLSPIAFSFTLCQPAHLSSDQPTILTTSATGYRPHPLHSAPFLGTTCSRMMPTLTTSLARPHRRSATLLRRKFIRSSTGLVNFNHPYRLVTGGWDRETSRSSEHVPSTLVASLTSGLAIWTIERSPSSLIGVTCLQTTRLPMRRVTLRHCTSYAHPQPTDRGFAMKH